MSRAQHYIPCEVVSDQLLDSFANDVILGCLDKAAGDPKSDVNRRILLWTSATWLQRLAVSPLPELPEQLKAVMDRIEAFCRAMVALLNPIPQVDSNFRHVYNMTKTETDHYLEKDFRQALKSNPFWKQVYLDVQKCSGAAKEWAGKLNDHMGNLKKCDPNDLLAMSVFVLEACAAWESMQGSLRKGALAKLEPLIAEKLTTLAQKISTSDKPGQFRFGFGFGDFRLGCGAQSRVWGLGFGVRLAG